MAPEREVLVLAENATYPNQSPEQDRERTGGQHHSMFGVVADGVKEIVFNKWKRKLYGRIHKLQYQEKSTVSITLPNNGATIDVQLIDVQDIIKELKQGTPRIVDLVIGVDFSYEQNETYDGVDKFAHAKPKIHYQTPLWKELRSFLLKDEIINIQSFYGLEYAKACAFMISKTLKKCKGAIHPEAESYVRLLNEKVFRSHRICSEWKDLKQCDIVNHKELSVNQIKSMSQEYIPMILRLFKEDKNQKGRNLGNFSPILKNLQRLMQQLRSSAIDQFVYPEENKKISNEIEIQVERPILKTGSHNTKETIQHLFYQMNITIDVNKVALVAQTGSYLYNLQTPRSDKDYMIIYFDDIEDIYFPATRVRDVSKNVFDRPFGSEKAGEIEYECCSIMKYVSNCSLGCPTYTDLLFVDPKYVLYSSEEFNELRKMRSFFLTESCIAAYFTMISYSLNKAKEIIEKSSSVMDWDINDKAPFLKRLYHAFFRMFEVKRVLIGEDPLVRLETDSVERKHLMRIRNFVEENSSRDEQFDAAYMLEDAYAQLLEIKSLPATQRPSNIDLYSLASVLERIMRKQQQRRRKTLN